MISDEYQMKAAHMMQGAAGEMTRAASEISEAMRQFLLADGYGGNGLLLLEELRSLSLNPYQQMVAGNHSIGIIRDGKLIATDADVYVAPSENGTWISVNDSLPDEGVPVLLLHRNGTQWTGYKGMERSGFEDTFQPYPYFIDTGEHEMWEWGDIVLWRHLPVVDHVSFTAGQESK